MHRVHRPVGLTFKNFAHLIFWVLFLKYFVSPQALTDSQKNLSLLNTEMTLMRKAILQNRMALNIITALQGGTCAIMQTECHDESGNVSSLLNHMKKQMKTLSDLTLSLGT